MSTVFCVGIATLDLVFTVERFPRGEGKFPARSFTPVGGGIAANAAVAVARAGGRAALGCCLGDDRNGDLMLADLVRDGVDVSAVQRRPGCTSAVSSVLVDGAGERQITVYLDPGLYTGAPPPSLPADTGAVMADMRWVEGALAALTDAARRGVPGVLDLDTAFGEDRGGLLAVASHVVASLDGLCGSTGCDDPAAGLEALAAHTPAQLAVTLGGDGVLWREDGRTVHLPAVAVDVRDTLGAGDVFHGILAMCLAGGAGFVEALGEASLVAALKCTRPGGRAGIPDRAAIDAFRVARGS